MKRIYNIGIMPEDKKARRLLEKVGKVEKIHLSVTPIHLLGLESMSPKPNFLLLSVGSAEEIEKRAS